MAVKKIPDGYHTVTPYLVVHGAAQVLEFAVQAFGAREVERMTRPDGTIMHAEMKIGDSIVMMGEASAEHPAMPAMLHVYVDDADTIYKRALQAGATSVREPADQFYGDRSGGVKDAAGNHWWIATHKEDVPPDELKRRAEAFARQQG
jgi:uncharacterized glyoxalase superfamily protein PhnB